jgi:hypothetical protein
MRRILSVANQGCPAPESGGARRGRRSSRPPAESKDGLPLFPVRSGAAVVTLGLVNRLRDESPWLPACRE